MSKSTAIPKKAVLALAEIDEKIKALYSKREEMVLKIIKKCGSTTSGVVEQTEEEKPFLRVKITDQLKEFRDGKTLFTTASYSRYRVEITRLKHPPK